ncbi:MAG: hypothetical protein ABI999_13505 [Acidobacteriota bacterium]
MKNRNITAIFIALALGLAFSGCGGTTTSNSANSNGITAAKKNDMAANTTASPASSAPAAKQGTPPKADFTMSADDLHKDYEALLKKDPASVGAKYENKNIQFTGTITRMNTVQLGTGSGVDHVYSVSGNGKDDDASCTFNPETEESAKLAIGQKVTFQGTQTHNQNMPPRIEKCFVIKGAQ